MLPLPLLKKIHLEVSTLMVETFLLMSPNLGFPSVNLVIYRKHNSIFWSFLTLWSYLPRLPAYVTVPLLPTVMCMHICPSGCFVELILHAPYVISYLFKLFTKAKCSSSAILLFNLAFSSSQVECKASSCFWYSAISFSWLFFLSSKIIICLVNFEALGGKKPQLSTVELNQLIQLQLHQ